MLNKPDRLNILIHKCKEEGIHKITIHAILSNLCEPFTHQNEKEVAKVLKGLGFTKRHTRKGNIWIYNT